MSDYEEGLEEEEEEEEDVLAVSTTALKLVPWRVKEMERTLREILISVVLSTGAHIAPRGSTEAAWRHVIFCCIETVPRRGIIIFLTLFFRLHAFYTKTQFSRRTSPQATSKSRSSLRTSSRMLVKRVVTIRTLANGEYN